MKVGGGVRAPRVLLDRCSRTSAGLAVKRLALCQRPLATLLLSLKTELLFSLLLPLFLLLPRLASPVPERSERSRPKQAPAGRPSASADPGFEQLYFDTVHLSC